jgi:hypothetical protein
MELPKATHTVYRGIISLTIQLPIKICPHFMHFNFPYVMTSLYGLTSTNFFIEDPLKFFSLIVDEYRSMITTLA